MKSFFNPLLCGLACSQLASAIDLDVNSPASIKSTAGTIAHGIMTYYSANKTGTPATKVGTFPPPLYWWESGAVWGGLVDYWMYTKDSSYNPTISQGLLAQVGPNKDYLPPAYFSSIGNDDQSFWALAALSAAEYGFEVPSGNKSTLWSDLAEAVFAGQVPRWDDSSCNGGLRWQIFSSLSGYDYKNSISNGGFFQMAARLARYTGNQTYVDWAEKAWNWMEGVGLIDHEYNVFDGADIHNNCTNPNKEVWSYNPAMMLYGTAMMYNSTNGGEIWKNRTSGLVEAISRDLFSPFSNSTDVMFERACELKNICDNDQLSFKAYLGRWMAKSAVVAPYIADPVTKLLTRSAQAAAQSCSGGRDGVTCGERWWVHGWDGSYGIGQQLSALEVVQSLLLLRNPVAPQTLQDVLKQSTPSHTASVSSNATETVASNAGHRVIGSSVGTWMLPVGLSLVLGGTMGIFQ
ncbi:Hypothetical protein R9X50_00303700 [Acrodontium crateriforme]|uniref:Mannan endo-1,6-alpha-mannosidase n=1 Tax=Acrodontium crateriforme TaxID=150365 RepID=A0AAQ3M233_9PEZI|nr:Hypothetical protein R9X50_00303700 [Acrodontium crateriforme]